MIKQAPIKIQKRSFWILAFAFWLLPFGFKAQVNYVLNPSFEQVDSCPVYVYYIKALNWDSLSNGGGCQPDVMTPCYSNTTASNVLGVPINIYGRSYQYPRTGNNYHNFLLYRTIGNKEAEYLQGKFYKPLLNKTYCVTYYVNLSNNSKYAIDRIGAVIDNGQIQSPPCQPTMVPTSICSPSNIFLNDTLNWIKVQGLFLANGNETKIAIGNFNKFINTNAVITNSTSLDDYSYYFIDDISLIEVDLPAYGGADKYLIPGDSVYIGRPSEIGLDDDCFWYKLPNTTTPIDTVAGLWVKPVVTTTYVVKQDICGTVKWDTVVVYMSGVGINELKINNKKLKIYPNPANEIINVELEMINGQSSILNYQCSIINTLGQVLQTTTIQQAKAIINVKDLPNGIYVLNLKNKEQSLTKRFVIER